MIHFSMFPRGNRTQCKKHGFLNSVNSASKLYFTMSTSWSTIIDRKNGREITSKAQLAQKPLYTKMCDCLTVVTQCSNRLSNRSSKCQCQNSKSLRRFYRFKNFDWTNFFRIAFCPGLFTWTYNVELEKSDRPSMTKQKYVVRKKL